jgi:acyl-ACP thioesterase
MGFERNEIARDAWKEELRIRSYEIDLSGRVPVPVLLNFIQEAASNHADFLRLGVDDLEPLNRLWVLSRVKIDIATSPGWGDRVVLHTWPAGIDRLFALREVRIVDETERVIVSASSAWLVLDADTRRPVRIGRLVGDRGLSLEPDPNRATLEKLPPPERIDREHRLSVQLSDLDINDHVNNARYVEWVLNTYPLDFVQAHEVHGCEVNFLSECGYAEAMTIRTLTRLDETYLHAVARQGGEGEVCRIRLRWRPHRY